MRIVLVMLLGFILIACRQDYEEIHGIKIGASISEVQNLDSYTRHNQCEITIYHKHPFGEYSEVIIFELDGNVAAVSVRVSGEDEISDYIDFMTKKYGTPDITPDNEYQFNSQGNLFKIQADKFFSALTVIYATEKIDSIADDVFERCQD